MNSKTVTMIKGWVAMHNGNVEELARWMRRHLPVSLPEARKAIQEALAA